MLSKITSYFGANHSIDENSAFDMLFSLTCPYLLGGIEQLISSNDDTVERLNEIEEWHDGIQNRFDKQTGKQI